jgi:hypothetical protein
MAARSDQANVASSSSSHAQHIHKIGGIEVCFPNPPYGVQFSFMAKMIQTLNAGENALLEVSSGCHATSLTSQSHLTLTRHLLVLARR